jgi:predicted acetyltransferase
MMIELRELRLEDETAFRNAVVEFKVHNPDWEFAFRFDEGVPFHDYVKRVHGWSKGVDIGAFVPNTYLVALLDNKVIGRVSLRHELNANLLKDGGHLGYGIVPSERRKGYAKEVLRRTLPFARSVGLNKILLTCDDDNIGSWRTIEANAGILQDKLFEPGMKVSKRRYWIDLESR